jgi:hypothetical protein
MTHYRIEVYINKDTPNARWADVHPSDGKPYEYSTYDEAERMANLCYGRDRSIVRVREVTS